ncbi:thioredoxin domain-containing protein [archaeon]|nr:thioredoxin domain-containing protein [archaeon]
MNSKIIIAAVLILAVIAGVFLLLQQKPEYPDINTPVQFKGNPQAKVIVEEFSDFQCPACVAIEPYVEEVFNQFKDKIKLEYRHFPLPAHNFAEKAAEAAVCSADFGKFWQYHDALFQAKGQLDNQSLIRMAKNIGIDEKQFSNCLFSEKKKAIIEQDKKEGTEKGVNGTPTFFVNGEKVEGTFLSEILASLKKKIEQKISEVEQ